MGVRGYSFPEPHWSELFLIAGASAFTIGVAVKGVYEAVENRLPNQQQKVQLVEDDSYDRDVEHKVRLDDGVRRLLDDPSFKDKLQEILDDPEMMREAVEKWNEIDREQRLEESWRYPTEPNRHRDSRGSYAQDSPYDSRD